MRSFLPFYLLFFIQLPLAAQSEKLSIRTLSLHAVKMPELFTPDGKTLLPLTFSNVEPSKPFEVNRLNGLPIYTTPIIADDKAPPSYIVKLPGTAPAILLLAWLGPEGTPVFLAFPDVSATAGRKDWMVINSTSKHIAMQIGADKKPVAVKAGSQKSIHVDVPANVGSAVTIAAMMEDSWKPFYKTYWAIYEDKRCLILIIQDGEKMRVKQIFEDLPKRTES